MATVKVKFRASSVATKEGVLFYQVVHQRVARQISSGYRLFPSEWDAVEERVVTNGVYGRFRREYLLSLQKSLSVDLVRLRSVISRLDRSGGVYEADTVVGLYRASVGSCGFVSFAYGVIQHLRQTGKFHTAERYVCTLNSFMRFLNVSGGVGLDEFDSDLMAEYETFLLSNGVCQNTVSYYMRNLRAIYNRAVEKGLTMQRSPFKYVYTGIDKTVKRAVPLKVIRQIRDVDLSLNPLLDFARDLFMFSFYTRGMSFVDMAFLKKKDLQNGVLSYRRRKTNQKLFIKWEKPMQEIVGKYDTSGSPYLLPIIRNAEGDERRQYRSAAHLVNAKLKRLGEWLGLPMPLTSYVARHAWASIARSKNVSLSVISEAMGHDSERTTRIYLASLDTAVVDRANSLIIKSI